MKRTLRFLGAAAFALCSANALALFTDGLPPTTDEAHEFLAGTFQRYSIGYVVWHGKRMGDNDAGRTHHYRGNGCVSELGTGGRIFAVDWAKISSVQPSGQDAIYVMGQLVREASTNGRPYANFHLYFPDYRVTRSVSNAMEFLRSACQGPRTKFD